MKRREMIVCECVCVCGVVCVKGGGGGGRMSTIALYPQLKRSPLANYFWFITYLKIT